MFFGDEQLKCCCLFNTDALRVDKESKGSLCCCCCCCCCMGVGRDEVSSSCMRGDLLISFDFGTIGNPRFCCSRLCVAFVVLDWENEALEGGIAVSEWETAEALLSLFCPIDSVLSFSCTSLSGSTPTGGVDEFMCHFLLATAKTSS